jgi:hypothetical protein
MDRRRRHHCGNPVRRTSLQLTKGSTADANILGRVVQPELCLYPFGGTNCLWIHIIHASKRGTKGNLEMGKQGRP